MTEATDLDLLRGNLQYIINKYKVLEDETLWALDYAYAQPPGTLKRCPSDPCPFCTAAVEMQTAVADAEDLLERTRPAAVVSASTENGTHIFHPDYSDDGKPRRFIGTIPNGNLGTFTYVIDDHPIPKVGVYSEHWTEVPQ
jgi:hypothetical protein